MLTSIILLAGGSGKRFGATTPKQFLTLQEKPLFQHSLDLFLSLPDILEIIVVVDESYRALFNPSLKFALPGKERQDSVYNGLQEVSSHAEFIMIHDSARPLVSKESVLKVLKDGFAHKAATLAVPLKFTVKEAGQDHLVTKTLNRSELFEIQTPQVVAHDLFKKGFEKAKRENIAVTDDVSLIEILGLPVKLTIGNYSNIKITTPEDLKFANYLINEKL